ncbi:Sex-determining region Y protein [Wickerhamomyces ciferrii]|uniref:Sex-determining region Y protein n=1 Tax=Wickerhamomyces ciferrii (strain ATCC 14091 / BCRC 22168 / CBS 111 / JCM 3599 / NBRC 0793 / NRRL Y-1031 F-60-10) TaxID=1206466 RepID=K0KLT7_WICCF|nr:Sex-determining region Y protein [Wickerhamomyces ciferrii]CCH42289.1 Sex-determining region Y protein [Wickerhamomyces ciferrii]
MFTTFSPLPSPMINNNIHQDAPKHTLPPLSQIITSMPSFQQYPQAALPQQQPTPAPSQYSFQQPQQPMFQHQSEMIKREDYSPTIIPQRDSHSASQSPSQEVSTPTSPKYNSKVATDKCTCRNEGNHIPRPRNAFILFRQQHHQSVLDEGNVIRTNPDVSRELGKRWRDLSPKEKEHWNKLAEEEKKRHAEKYPGYRYIPRRCGKKGSCPYCKSKQPKQQQQQHTPPTSTSNTPEDMNSISSSEEHAIAQSFLSLRNQQPHPSYAPVATPVPNGYYSQPGHMAHVAYVQTTQGQMSAPVYYNQIPTPVSVKREEDGNSPTDKSKVCSFANILN